MGAYLSSPVKDKESEEHESDRYQYGVSAMQGDPAVFVVAFCDAKTGVRMNIWRFCSGFSALGFLVGSPAVCVGDPAVVGQASPCGGFLDKWNNFHAYLYLITRMDCVLVILEHFWGRHDFVAVMEELKRSTSMACPIYWFILFSSTGFYPVVRRRSCRYVCFGAIVFLLIFLCLSVPIALHG